MDYSQKFILKIGFGMLFMAYIVCFVIFWLKEKQPPETEHFNIVSCNLQTEHNGIFILGTGELSDAIYYVTYKVNKDGGKEYFKMDVRNTKIYDHLEEDEASYVEVDRKNGVIEQIRLYVPKGTVIEKVDLDSDSQDGEIGPEEKNKG